MEKFRKGDLVIMPFPFSDMKSSKIRPAYVAAVAGEDEFIMCQVTSAMRADRYSIPLSDSDLSEGTIHIASMIKPHKLFTADVSLIVEKVGALNTEKIIEIEKTIIKIVSQ
jgi:mRNA interferase MazF